MKTKLIMLLCELWLYANYKLVVYMIEKDMIRFYIEDGELVGIGIVIAIF